MKLLKNVSYNPYLFQLGGVALLGIIILETCADLFDWYYIFPKFDTPMHILGGFMVGCFALAYTPVRFNYLQKLLWAVFWVLLIGGLVEVVEFGLDHRFNLGIVLQSNPLDTYTDIMHDFFGGVIAFFLAYFTKRI